MVGKLAEGKATGSMATVGPLQSYIAKPAQESKGKRALVITTDLFGIMINSQLIADSFARDLNATVFIPDLFDGKPMPAWSMEPLFTAFFGFYKTPKSIFGRIFNFLYRIAMVVMILPWVIPFVIKHINHKKKIPKVEAFLAALRKDGYQQIGMIGYCYGVPFCMEFASRPPEATGVDAISAVHGQIKVPKDIEALKKPCLFLCADKDGAFPHADRLKAEAMLRERKDAANYVFRDYPGCSHGFAIRGDVGVETVRKAKQDCYEEAVKFFDQHLKA